jgi:hypothetical protein
VELEDPVVVGAEVEVVVVVVVPLSHQSGLRRTA